MASAEKKSSPAKTSSPGKKSSPAKKSSTTKKAALATPARKQQSRTAKNKPIDRYGFVATSPEKKKSSNTKTKKAAPSATKSKASTKITKKAPIKPKASSKAKTPIKSNDKNTWRTECDGWNVSGDSIAYSSQGSSCRVGEPTTAKPLEDMSPRTMWTGPEYPFAGSPRKSPRKGPKSKLVQY